MKPFRDPVGLEHDLHSGCVGLRKDDLMTCGLAFICGLLELAAVEAFLKKTISIFPGDHGINLHHRWCLSLKSVNVVDGYTI
jgi:hypothetical protein